MKGIQNPVLKKELKLRFRSFKSFSGLLFYLLTLLIFTGGFFLVATEFKGKGFITPDINITFFTMLSYVQLALVLFITPALTAGAISTEREKQTLNILLTTSQTSWQIIFGKLSSSIAYLVLLLFAGLPISSLVFFFGGVSPGDFLLVYVLLMIMLIALASIGIMVSTLIRKTIIAIVTTYGFMLVLTVLTAFFAFISLNFQDMTSEAVTETMPFSYIMLAINPFVHLSNVIFPEVSTGITQLTNIDMSLWGTYIAFYLIITVVTLSIATRKIRVNMK
ncbi:MAG: ABC transporter permease subunit [Kurthia sp.]|nr:ABC transporter permease subunit [Candidatus Kurthia equi]